MKNKKDYEELFSKMIKKYHSQIFLGQINGAKAKENYYHWCLECIGLVE